MAQVHADGGERSRLAVVANVFPGLAEGMNGEGWRVRRRRLGALRLAPSADGLRRPAVFARFRWVRPLGRGPPASPQIVLSLEPARQRAQPEESADTGLPTNGNVAERQGCVGAIRTAALGRGRATASSIRSRKPPMLPGTGRKGASMSAVRMRCLEAPTRAMLATDDVRVRLCRLGNTAASETLPRAADPKVRKRGFTSDRRNCCSSNIKARSRDCRVACASAACTD
jgi:hypothetical protein